MLYAWVSRGGRRCVPRLRAVVIARGSEGLLSVAAATVLALLASSPASAERGGSVSQAVTFAAGPVYGDAALLLVALILLRILPQGITGRIFTRSV